jgi:hypothetical protein
MAQKLVGLAAIDKAIKAIGGVADNLNERVQETAVAIIEHAAGPGNGDVSRALTLCQRVKATRTLNVAYLVGFFAAFAGTNVNLNKATVNLFARDSKKQRGFRVAEARANNWFDAIDKDGNRAAWYAGPQPEDYTPEGVGGVAERITRFVDRVNRDLERTKTVRGKEVPLFKLSDDELKQVHNALAHIESIAKTLERAELLAETEAMRERLVAEAEQDDNIVILRGGEDKAVA